MHARSDRIFHAPLALSVLILETHGIDAFFFRLKGVGNRKKHRHLLTCSRNLIMLPLLEGKRPVAEGEST